MPNNVLEYLAAAAEKYPQKRAVAYQDNAYTYRELNELSKRLGAAIKSQGLTNMPVAVVADRSTDTIVYFMAALYSGNFYVPIDPELHTDKMAAIFEDAQFQAVLGNGAQESKIRMLGYGGAFYTMDDAGQETLAIPEQGGEDPLYMVYTSGSTGKPKGVLKSHKAVIRYIEAYCNTFSFSEDEIIGNQTPFFFDASAKDLYLLLKKGCTMEILPSKLFMMPPELIDYLNEKGVTFAPWVPSAISIVAQLNPFSLVKPTTLKKVFFVGEVMPMKHLNRWRRALPDIQYVNLYGSSEIAGICCYYEVRGEYPDDAVLPMGVPLENCRIYLLDGDTVITEPGKTGEIYLVSDSLALEYFHDPEKTEQAFRVRDFGDGPHRCFKTGDLAQYDGDGNLLFVARTDFQIKHMGHRIELGEIEAVANALPEIGRCCCLYNAPKRKIVLFCELTGGCQLKGQQIRSILRTKLSEYMLPGKVQIMDALPLNQNGKIDRQLLKTYL